LKKNGSILPKLIVSRYLRQSIHRVYPSSCALPFLLTVYCSLLLHQIGVPLLYIQVV
jgi:hypothetical protein